MKEFARISRYLAPLASPEGLGLLDDAALIPGPGKRDYAITKDAIVEGVHFLPGTDAGLIAKKLLRTNLSDIAAMGAAPKFYLIAAALPASVDDAWYKGFTAALAEEQEVYNIALIGGDTASTSGPITLSLTMLGEVPRGKALLRSGAKPGDGVYVSGMLGDAALGLQLIKAGKRDAYLENRYHYPEPRMALGIALRGIANACMDISDGLLGDISHICKASGVSATLHADRLPLSDAAKAESITTELAATGGDDYELLFTVPKKKEKKLAALSEKLGLSLTRIGEITEGNGVKLLDEDGKTLDFKQQGWQHA